MPAAFDRVLIFSRGGAAYLNAEGRSIDTCTTPPCGPETVEASTDDTFFGWTVGGGVEVALSRHWTVGAEYRLLRFFDCFQPSGVSKPDGPVTQSIGAGGIEAMHTVRGQVSFRW